MLGESRSFFLLFFFLSFACVRESVPFAASMFFFRYHRAHCSI